MIRPLLAGAACVALLAACNQERSAEPIDDVQDMASAPVGEMSAATLGANTVGGYVSNAVEGDIYEIRAADIALERTQNAQVRELAQMIKSDHTQASESLTQMVPTAAPDVEMPDKLDERRQGLLDNLRSAPAADFNQTYIDQQIAAHNEALTLHRGFADNTDAPRLAEHARTVIPKLEMHLRRAEEIKAAM